MPRLLPRCRIDGPAADPYPRTYQLVRWTYRVRRGKRESGMNPELPRSGMWERPSPDALTSRVGKRRPIGTAIRPRPRARRPATVPYRSGCGSDRDLRGRDQPVPCFAGPPRHRARPGRSSRDPMSFAGAAVSGPASILRGSRWGRGPDRPWKRFSRRPAYARRGGTMFHVGARFDRITSHARSRHRH